VSFAAPETQTLSARLDAAAAALTGAARNLRSTDPAGPAFAAGHDGTPGELGRALAARWAATLGDRAADLEAAAARVTTTADAVRAAHEQYATTDATTDATIRRRLAGGSGHPGVSGRSV
jgi:hypothetical protein